MIVESSNGEFIIIKEDSHFSFAIFYFLKSFQLFCEDIFANFLSFLCIDKSIKPLHFLKSIPSLFRELHYPESLILFF